ncbi:hypothetical protein [Ralstonia solanacearum]|uniref:hypothetical protein n=1 Tax=Ralstonia solanacearum TaxID=305 RepID=UPI0011D262A9|nr:hypothetical protein [Ralstonia solanacearum]
MDGEADQAGVAFLARNSKPGKKFARKPGQAVLAKGLEAPAKALDRGFTPLLRALLHQVQGLLQGAARKFHRQVFKKRPWPRGKMALWHQGLGFSPDQAAAGFRAPFR